MKRADVQIGAVYAAKVNGRLVRVKILFDREVLYERSIGDWRHNGWNALNLNTGRNIRIKTAARLRPLERRHDAETHTD